MEQALKTIGQASKEAGVTPFVLRAWEKRYKLTTPIRTETNRRLYSESDVEKLRLLAELTKAGYSIGQLATQTVGELLNLQRGLRANANGETGQTKGSTPDISPETFVESGLEAVRALDTVGLQSLLSNANIMLSKPHLIHSFITPLLHKVGDLWETGEIRITHEHMCAACVRSFLSSILMNYRSPSNAPTLVVCTPQGQEHEIGALAAALIAKMSGWDVCYLGANLPSEEIAAGVIQSKASAMALSISYPDPDVVQLKTLREVLPKMPILVGGNATEQLRRPLLEYECEVITSLHDLPIALRGVLKAPKTQKPKEN